MKKFLLPLMAILYSTLSFSQTTFRATVLDSATHEPLAGAFLHVKNTTLGMKADASGVIVLKNIPSGTHTLVFTCIGYRTLELTLLFAATDTSVQQQLFLVEEKEEIEEVIISSTRTSRTIANVPTRVETIDVEEIEEKINMRPANVAMILNESTGIKVQQTSATSGNAGIRIQGLDGRYTQLLKDGSPNFGNFAGGLSIMEIPPLDLQQVEIIKGPASTLYGAGAIAGVVNFISKTPGEKKDYSFLVNQSHVGQTNLGMFASARNEKAGYTFMAAVNRQKAYDVDKDGFTELPKSSDLSIQPRIYLYPSSKTTFVIGNCFTKANRTGGDIVVINNRADSAHTYFEKNTGLRNNAFAELTYKASESRRIVARTNYSYFNRSIALSDYSFSGINNNSFTDLSHVTNTQNQVLIVGANFIYDRFSEKDTLQFPKRHFVTRTGGVYAQHTWDVSERLKLESGVRADWVHYSNVNYGKNEVFVLPRISALLQLSKAISSRIGAGLGYKTPSLFTEQTEALQYRNVMPLSNVRSERSYGGTADLSYKVGITNDLFVTVNQMFFYTYIMHAAVLHSDTAKRWVITNTNKPLSSAGFETNVKVIFKEDLKLFAGYTFTDVSARYLPAGEHLPLIARNRVNLILMYEKEKNFKLGFECYYTDRQYLSDATRTPSFWNIGAMAEKTFGIFSIFANFENITDNRQSRIKSVVNGSRTNPTFDDIWTSHPEGFVVNAGVKIRL